MDVEPDFRPYVAGVEGDRLVLRRRRTLADWLMRACMYVLLLCVLVLFALIPVGAYTRWSRWGDVAKPLLGALVFLPLTWFVLKLVLLAFRLEGFLRVDVAPGCVDVVGRGALRSWRERTSDVVALEARTVRRNTRYGAVRWLTLAARAGAGKIELGYLQLGREAETRREAAVRAAAAQIADRLGVPLELYDEAGARVDVR